MTIPRDHLARYFGNDRRIIGFFEEQSKTVDETSALASTTATTTDTMRQATVILLSGNGEFENERILRRGPGLQMYDTGSALIIELADSLKWLANPASLGNHADDVAAAAANVPVGGYYRTGSIIKFRVA